MDAQSVADHIIEHYGTKGMKWGVRKQYDLKILGRSNSVVKGSESFSKQQAASMNNIAKKMEKAYGFKIHEFKPLEGRYDKKRYIAYVSVRNKGDNVIHMTNRSSLNEELMKLQKTGWFIPTDKNRLIEANITHESAHAMFHSSNVKGKGVIGYFNTKTPIDEIRMSAWRKAEEQGRKDKDIVSKKFRPDSPQFQMNKKLSKYADQSMFIEEAEAELFSAYHWSPNPPKFVDAFMNEVHNNMGKKIKPFSGRKNMT